jgi:hypothetical protein
MAGLAPAIHVVMPQTALCAFGSACAPIEKARWSKESFDRAAAPKGVDGRDEPGHDG